MQASHLRKCMATKERLAGLLSVVVISSAIPALCRLTDESRTLRSMAKENDGNHKFIQATYTPRTIGEERATAHEPEQSCVQWRVMVPKTVSAVSYRTVR